MVSQRLFGLAVAKSNGTSERLKPSPRTVPPDKLFADLLKRQARKIMGDVTECPADTIPAHLARLGDLKEIINHALRHELVPGPETRLSGAQLMSPHTLEDYLAAMEITQRTHRAPVFVNSRDTALSQINHKLDTIAGLLATNAQACELFTSEGEQ